MKTILLFTNLSTSDEHLAEIALDIAVKSKANLLLLHIMLFEKEGEADISTVDQKLKDQKLAILKNLVRKLSQKSGTKDKNGYIPAIQYQCIFANEINISDSVSEKIWMVIMGLQDGQNLLNNFIYGTFASQIIKQINCPVLLVNKKAHLKALQKIALSTEFDINEIEAVKFLIEFSTVFNSEIILVHDIHNTIVDLEEGSITVKPAKVKFPNLYYNKIKSGLVDKELQIFSSKENFDTIGIVYNKETLFGQIFYSDVTMILIQRPYSSIFVFPMNRQKEFA